MTEQEKQEKTDQLVSDILIADSFKSKVAEEIARISVELEELRESEESSEEETGGFDVTFSRAKNHTE